MSIRQGNNIIAGTPALKTINGESIVGSGDIEVGKTSYTPPLLSCMWSDHLLNDIQWLRADTFSWQLGDVYEAVYEHLVNDWQTGSIQTETVAGRTFSIMVAKDGHKLFSTKGTGEQLTADLFNETGVAWYYILDIENKRFKLPRTKFGFTGLRDTVGNYVPESLPNINIGNASIMAWYNNQPTWTQGAIQKTSTVNAALSTNGSWTYTGASNFNASRSSSTYQDNAPVQERATQMYLYFYVGNFTKTAIENTAGLNAEMFNDMATKSMFQVVDELPASPVAGVFYYVREI